MANNLYGGYLYEQTPFIFDKIYQNYQEMIIDENPPLIGRFVLVKYSEFAFSQDMVNLMAHYVVNYQYPDDQPEPNEYYPATNEEEEWCNNYETDYAALIENTENPPSVIDLIPSDRKIYQIVWDNANENYSYMEIGCLTSTLSAEGITNLIQQNQLYTNYKLTEAIDYTDGEVTGAMNSANNYTNIQIQAEKERAKAVEKDHKERIETMEVFWESADNATEVIDTLKELQDYIASDKSGAAQMASNIQANASNIQALQDIVKDGGTLEVRVDVAEKELITLAQENQERMSEIQQESSERNKAIKTLQKIDTDLLNRVGSIEDQALPRMTEDIEFNSQLIQTHSEAITLLNKATTWQTFPKPTE